MQLVGEFRIESVKQVPLTLLWQLAREHAGVSRDEFDRYFDGMQSGVAIQIADVVEFQRPIALDELRAAWPGFQPPQGFRYIERPSLKRFPQLLGKRLVA